MWCGLTENIIKRKIVRRSQDRIKHKTFWLEASKIMLGLRPLKTKVLVHVFVWQAITNINETIILKLAKINMVLVSLVWPELTVLIVDIFPWAHVELTKVLLGALPFLSCFSSKWQTSEEPTPVWPGSTFLGVKNWSFIFTWAHAELTKPLKYQSASIHCTKIAHFYKIAHL